jgi:hypothetical protein
MMNVLIYLFQNHLKGLEYMNKLKISIIITAIVIFILFGVYLSLGKFITAGIMLGLGIYNLLLLLKIDILEYIDKKFDE